MAGTTTVFGFPFPENADAPNGPQSFQTLAQAVEDYLAAATASLSGTNTSLYNYTGTTVRRAGGTVHVNVNMQRISGSSSGTDNVLFTLPSGFRPPVQWYDVCRAGSATFTLDAHPDGSVTARGLTISTSQRVQGSLSFPRT